MGNGSILSLLQSAIDGGVNIPPTFQQVLSANAMLGNSNNTLYGLLAEVRKNIQELLSVIFILPFK